VFLSGVPDSMLFGADQSARSVSLKAGGTFHKRCIEKKIQFINEGEKAWGLIFRMLSFLLL